MRFRFKRSLDNEGFILIMAILLIGLLMIFMTAIVNVVNYTNKRTLFKSEDQQLQITAQSASLVVKEYLEEKLKDPAIADAMRTRLKNDAMVQAYQQEESYITVKINKIKGVNKGLVTIYATSEADLGAAGVVSFVINLSSGGAKSELLDNLVVAYNPEEKEGSILDENRDYKNVVMEGDMLVDNRYREALNYGDKNKYKKFVSDRDDKTAVFLRNGLYTSVKATGNLMLTGNIFGFESDKSISRGVDFVSSEGQLVVDKANIGGTPAGYNENTTYIVSTIGAGGYTPDSEGESAGKMLLNDVKMQEGYIRDPDTGEVERPRASLVTSEGVDVEINKISGNTQRIFAGGNLDFKSTKDINKINNIEVAGESKINISNNLETKSIITRGNSTINGKIDATEKLVSTEGDLKILGGDVKARHFIAANMLDISSGVTCTLGQDAPSAFSVADNYRIPDSIKKGDAAFVYLLRDAEGILNNHKTFEVGEAMKSEKPIDCLTLRSPSFYLSTKATHDENITLVDLVNNDTENAFFKLKEDSDGYLLEKSNAGYKNFGLLMLKGDSDVDRTMVAITDEGKKENVNIYGKTLYIDVSGNNYVDERTGIRDQRCMDILLSSDNETVVLNNKIVIRYTAPSTDETDLINMDYVRFFVPGNKSLELGENFSIEYKNTNNPFVDPEGFDFNDHHYTKLKPDVYFMGLRQENKKPTFTVKCKYLNAVIVAPYAYVDFSNMDENNKTVFEGSVICKNFAMPKAGICKNYRPFSFDYALSDDVFKFEE